MNEIPLILSNSSALLGSGDHDWAWKKESQGKLAEVLNKYPELKMEYEDLMKEVIKMVKDKKSSKEIQSTIQERMKVIVNKIPEDEETIKFFEEMEGRAEEMKNSPVFNAEEFRAEVKEFIQKYSAEYNQATEEEKEELVNYILASNEKVDDLLKRLTEKNTLKKVIKKFQKKIDNKIKNNEKIDYNEIMEEINQDVDEIEEAQLTQVYDEDLRLESPYGLKPRQQFSFTLEDILVEKRADVDFFEFISVERLFEPLDENEGYLVVTDDTLTGVAPQEEHVYFYDVKLKYTSFRTGGESKIYNAEFTLYVGDKYNNDQLSFKKALLVVIVVLASLSIISFGCICIRRIKNRNIISYEDFDAEVQNARKSIDSPGSDLENTADNSQD